MADIPLLTPSERAHAFSSNAIRQPRHAIPSLKTHSLFEILKDRANRALGRTDQIGIQHPPANPNPDLELAFRTPKQSPRPNAFFEGMTPPQDPRILNSRIKSLNDSLRDMRDERAEALGLGHDLRAEELRRKINKHTSERDTLFDQVRSTYLNLLPSPLCICIYNHVVVS